MMLPHPILASEDDEEFVIRAILGLPDLLESFFDCIEALYIEAKGTEYNTRANMLYLTIQHQLQILSTVPNSSFLSYNSETSSKGVDGELPKLLDRLSGLFLEDVISIGPQALWWKKPCLRLATDCAEHMRRARIRFPWRLRLQRELVSFNSPVFVVFTVLFSLSVLFAAACVVVLPAVGPPATIGVPVGAVSAALLLFFGGLLISHFVFASRALFLVHTRMFEMHMALGATSGPLAKGPFGRGESKLVSVLRHSGHWEESGAGGSAANTGSGVKVEKGRHTKKGYYTIPYGSDIGYIDGRLLDSQIPMIAFDAHFLITRWNNAVEVMTGFLEDGCIGKPLSELIQSPSGTDIHELIRKQRRNTPFKIKIRALASAPMTLYTVVAPIMNPKGEQAGSILICANVKDDLRDHRSYIHNYLVSEASEALRVLGARLSLSHADRIVVRGLKKFISNSYASMVESLAREMVSEWEWTNVEQLLGRAFGPALSLHEVNVDGLFPPTLCLDQMVPKVMGTVVTLSGGICKANLQVLNLMGNIFSLSASFSVGDRCRPWNLEELEDTLRPLLLKTGGNMYFHDERVILHFPCQVAAILDENELEEKAGDVGQAQQLLTQARAIVNCTVNVVTAITNMVDQHNLSLILLKTMFVSLASVQERNDLEQRLSARPCEVDVVICDSDWLSSSRDLLLRSDHGAIVIPIVDSEAPLSQGFKYVIRMPIVGRDVQQMMVDVGKHVSVKKDALTARQERERILTLRQDSPWTRGRLLGRGSYGAVYEATSELTGGKMAVKMFYFGVDREDAINQLLNEIKIMCSLNHVNIVHYFHCERTGDNVYLFMELCEASLTDIIVRRKKKPFSLTVMQMLRQVLNAIVYLHGRGITHRDIKPQNILLKGDVIKITDFGTARQGDATKEVTGTFRYMAPEVYKGEPHSLPCDIWSIGCLACELFACPPRFMDQPSLLGEMTSAMEYLDNIPSNPVLRDFLLKCFRVEPDQRPTSHDLLAHPLLSGISLSADVDKLPTVFDIDRTKAYDPTLDSAFSINSK